MAYLTYIEYRKDTFECPHCRMQTFGLTDSDVIDLNEHGSTIRQCPICGRLFQIRDNGTDLYTSY